MSRIRKGDTVKDKDGNRYKVKGFKPQGFVDLEDKGTGRSVPAIFGKLLTKVDDGEAANTIGGSDKSSSSITTTRRRGFGW